MIHVCAYWVRHYIICLSSDIILGLNGATPRVHAHSILLHGFSYLFMLMTNKPNANRGVRGSYRWPSVASLAWLLSNILFCQHKTLEDINSLFFRQSFCEQGKRLWVWVQMFHLLNCGPIFFKELRYILYLASFFWKVETWNTLKWGSLMCNNPQLVSHFYRSRNYNNKMMDSVSIFIGTSIRRIGFFEVELKLLLNK